MLKTPWPPRSRSTISSPERASTVPSAPNTRFAVASSPPDSRRHTISPARLTEVDPGVEELLDHLQLDDIGVGVAPLGTRAVRVGERRPQKTGARPVVELAIGDPDEPCRPAGPGSPPRTTPSRVPPGRHVPGATRRDDRRVTTLLS